MSQAVMVTTVHEIELADDVEALFRAHYGRLVRALTLVAGDQETAADAVQDAFVKAHLRWRKVSRYDDPVGWIRRVAINRLRDEHRRAGRKQRAIDRLGAAADDMVSGPGDAERPEELAALLADLPRQQRLSIALYYVEGLSVAEVAEALGISDGAVKYHLHRGRERLRNRLSGATDGGVDG